MTTSTETAGTAPDRVSNERLREILSGCEGVQGGPWKLDTFAAYVWAPSEKGGDFPLMDGSGENGRVVRLRGWGHYTGNGSGALGLSHDDAAARQRQTGAHIARLDPATVSSIVSELLALRTAPATDESRDAVPVVWLNGAGQYVTAAEKDAAPPAGDENEGNVGYLSRFDEPVFSAATLAAKDAEITGLRRERDKWKSACMQAREGCNQRSVTILYLRSRLERTEALSRELDEVRDRLLPFAHYDVTEIAVDPRGGFIVRVSGHGRQPALDDFRRARELTSEGGAE